MDREKLLGRVWLVTDEPGQREAVGMYFSAGSPHQNGLRRARTEGSRRYALALGEELQLKLPTRTHSDLRTPHQFSL